MENITEIAFSAFSFFVLLSVWHMFGRDHKGSS